MRIHGYKYMADVSNDYRDNLKKLLAANINDIMEGVSSPEYTFSKEMDKIWFYANNVIIDGEEIEHQLKCLVSKVEKYKNVTK